ncbi:MAG: HDIG domain-containing protein [Acidobacteriota bacterium]|nr:HDIG domain-containing protein [Blastocatellia bacterium]MDW8411397.1 HDIG domain-containing protein [Acidobacteriota bacterium]
MANAKEVVRKLKGKVSRFLRRQAAKLPALLSSWYGLAVAALLLALISGYSFSSIDVAVRNGVLQSDLIAPADFSYIDHRATQLARESEASKVLPIYEYNPAIGRDAVAYFNTEWEKLRTQFQQEVAAHPGILPTHEESAAMRQFVKQFASEAVRSQLFRGEVVLAILASKGFSPELQRRIAEAIGEVTSRYIYEDDAVEVLPRRITIRNIETAEQGEVRSIELVSLFEAQRRLHRQLQSILSTSEADKVYDTLKSLVGVNLVYSEQLTRAAKDLAEARVRPVVVNYKKNQLIAKYGERVDQQLLDSIRMLSDRGSWKKRTVKVIGYFVLLLGILIGLKRFCQLSRIEQLEPSKSFALLCIILLIQIGVIRLAVAYSGHLLTLFGAENTFYNQPQFLLPFALAALLAAFLLDSTAAQTCALLTGIFTGFITEGEMVLVAYAVMSGIAAAYAVKEYQHRNSITKAGLIISGVNILTILIELLINGQTSWQAYLLNVAYGFIGGLLTASIASLMIPIVESIFDILTDVKLLELSNMDLPLLRDLAATAAGTYQHSLAVSSLAEAAAEAIGANSLLVRVGCYYHDVGKMMAPEMFIENQAGRENPHDRMDPKRSASVITGHVRKGILLAEEHGLPQQIIDLIPQHHGTRKLHYFYNKALEKYSKTGDPVKEEHYRYPGPKPQTREAAIVMMADSAEASVRSLDEPTPENIRNIVKLVTEDILADGQLDECTLTIKEFNLVREALVEALCSVYHQRVKYPGFNRPELEETEGGLPETRPAAQKVDAGAAKPAIGDKKKKKVSAPGGKL